jgi:hypothetical protein
MKNPDLAKKFEKLIQAGVLRTGWFKRINFVYR